MAGAEVDALEAMECPRLDTDAALQLAGRLYGLTGGSAKEMDGYDDNNFWLRPEAVVDNPHLDDLPPDGFTLKVTNSKDSLNVNYIEGQNCLLAFLGPGHAVRLLEFVRGELLARVPWEMHFALMVGMEAARINSLLDEVHVPALLSRTTEWGLAEAPKVTRFVHFVTDAAKRTMVQEVLQAFQEAVKEHADELQRDCGLIHGDINQFNVLVGRRCEDGGEDQPWTIVGVLDLGDCHCAPRLFEVALAATYMSLTSGDVEAVRGVLQGYHRRRPLNKQGVNLIRVFVCARLCQSLVMGLRSHALDPQNAYVLDSQTNGWKILRELWEAPKGSFEQLWMKALEL